jgi:hypothetical protein
VVAAADELADALALADAVALGVALFGAAALPPLGRKMK